MALEFLPRPNKKWGGDYVDLRTDFLRFLRKKIESNSTEDITEYVKVCFIEDGLKDWYRKHFHVALYWAMSAYLIDESQHDLFWKLLKAVDNVTDDESLSHISERYNKFKVNNCCVLALTIIKKKDCMKHCFHELRRELRKTLDRMYKLQKDVGHGLFNQAQEDCIKEAQNIVNFEPTV